jgi:hypothetical protein
MKPICRLIGENGNIFNLIGLAARALKEAEQHEKATEMTGRVMKASSYDEAIRIIMEYVEVE